MFGFKKKEVIKEKKKSYIDVYFKDEHNDDVDLQTAVIRVARGPLGELKKVYGIEICLMDECNELVVSRLRDLYKEHLEADIKLHGFRPKPEYYERQREVKKVFKYVDSDGYMDDKVIIDRAKYEYYESAETCCEGELLVGGRIRLIDGTVLLDIENGIYHPGKWVDYVIELTEELKAKREYESKMRRAEENKRKLEKILENRKIYEEKHSPIDDSKFFK